MELPLTHKSHSPRDVFLYLLVVGTLYISAWRLIDLIFQYVDALLPDKLEGTYYSYGEIRTSMATLIIVFPIYLATTWYLRKDVIQNPGKRDLGIRKWLLNLTLFIAAITILVDLVTLTNTFLNGELTLRFALKVITVLIVAGTILAYYLWDLRHEIASGEKPSRILAGAASLVVIVSIISGFFIVGLPSTQRKKRFDERRVMNLEFLQAQIITFWQLNQQRLPRDTNEFLIGVPGTVESNDPETNVPYEYRPTGAKNSFELCATFSFPTDNDKNRYTGYSYYPGLPTMDTDLVMHNWEHEDGRVCFQRTINPKIYQYMPVPTAKPR